MEKEKTDVPYIVYEGEMARAERRDKRQWIVIIFLIVSLLASNIGWLVYESQFDIGSILNDCFIVSFAIKSAIPKPASVIPTVSVLLDDVLRVIIEKSGFVHFLSLPACGLFNIRFLTCIYNNTFINVCQ